MPVSKPPKLEPIGLVGLGLMGQGIAACLLAHGLRVIAYNRTVTRLDKARRHIGAMLRELVAEEIVPAARVADWEDRFQFQSEIAGLAPCPFIIETVTREGNRAAGVDFELDLFTEGHGSNHSSADETAAR